MARGLGGRSRSAPATAAGRPRSLRYRRPPMIDRIQAHLDDIRLGVRQRGLRGREQAALARLGQVTLADGGSRAGRLATLAVDAAASRSRLAALEEERQTALAAARVD